MADIFTASLNTLSSGLYAQASDLGEEQQISVTPGDTFIQRRKRLVHVVTNPDMAEEFGEQGGKGWKLHIALDPEESNISRAFNIVLSAAAKHGIMQFKCFEESLLSACKIKIETEKARKIMTVYYFQGYGTQDKAIRDFMLEVEHNFRTEHIQPCNRPESELMITGSKFFSYRDDRLQQGTDPFTDFTIPAKIVLPEGHS